MEGSSEQTALEALEQGTRRIVLTGLQSDRCNWNDDYGDGKICLAATTNSQTKCLTAVAEDQLVVEGILRQKNL